MNNTIKKIWESYITESAVQTAEEKLALNKIVRTEEELHGLLNATQIELLEKYSNNINELNCICEAKAFSSGVRFAVGFLLDALYN